MPRTSLSATERRARDRAVVLAALSGEDKKEIAERHGISLQRVYQLVKEETEDAEEELEYRRRVVELLRGCSKSS